MLQYTQEDLNYLLDKEDEKEPRERSKRSIILSNVEEKDLLVSDGGDPIRKLINKTLLGEVISENEITAKKSLKTNTQEKIPSSLLLKTNPPQKRF